MRAAALTIAALALVPPAGAAGTPDGKPSLGVLTPRPLTLQGRNFDAGEQIRVQAIGKAGASRLVVATRSGSFTVRFSAVTTHRCEIIRSVAIGASGNRATVKYLPAPVCRIDLRPGGRPGSEAG